VVPFGEGVLKHNGMLVSYIMQTHFNLDFRLTLGITFLPMFLFCGNLRGGGVRGTHFFGKKHFGQKK